jgi:aspartate/methionine/tyrosine aminotransferase
LNEFVVSHAPSFSQRAEETALLWGEKPLCEMVLRLRENRDFCRNALQKMPGMTVPAPEGAFYLFPKVKGWRIPSIFANGCCSRRMSGWRRV